MRRPPHYASTLLRQEEDNDTARGEEDTAVQEANDVEPEGQSQFTNYNLYHIFVY